MTSNEEPSRPENAADDLDRDPWHPSDDAYGAAGNPVEATTMVVTGEDPFGFPRPQVVFPGDPGYDRSTVEDFGVIVSPVDPVWVRVPTWAVDLPWLRPDGVSAGDRLSLEALWMLTECPDGAVIGTPRGAGDERCGHASEWVEGRCAACGYTCSPVEIAAWTQYYNAAQQ